MSTEDDVYNRCVGVAVEKCYVSGATRFQHHDEDNYLVESEHYIKCYEEEAANACNTPMLQHFVATIKLREKYFEKTNGKLEKMLEETPI